MIITRQNVKHFWQRKTDALEVRKATHNYTPQATEETKPIKQEPDNTLFDKQDDKCDQTQDS